MSIGTDNLKIGRSGRASSISYGLEADPELDAQFWQELLDMFFVRGCASAKAERSGQEDDDLVFFVQLEGVQNGNGRFAQPFFVRRWSPALEKVIGGSAWEVDWCRSFYLNLIGHSLRGGSRGRGPLLLRPAQRLRRCRFPCRRRRR